MNYRKNFFTYLAIITIVLLGSYFALNELTQLVIPSIVIWLILSFAAFTVVLYQYVVNTTQKSPSRFVTAALGSVTAKLLLSAAFFGVYVYLNKIGRVEVGLSLFVVYMSYTTLMTVQVGKYVRGVQDNMKEKSQGV